MNRQVHVNTKLNLNYQQINEAISYLDKPYIYSVTKDDMENIVIDYNEPEPEYKSWETYHDFDLDEYDQLKKYTFDEWLQKHKITVYGLAKKSGITTTQLYGLSNGERQLSNCSFDTVAAIANAFGMTADQLVSFIK